MVVRWRNILICFLLAAALVLVPATRVYALDYGVALKATTTGGTSLLIDGQFTELWFYETLPPLTSSVVNSTYVRRDNNENLEFGRAYNASAVFPGVQKNPVGFLWWNTTTLGAGCSFLDGQDHPELEYPPDFYYVTGPDIYFAPGRWYGFELQRDRSGGLYDQDYEARTWDPATNTWTHIAWFRNSNIVSSRGVLGTERNYAGSIDVDPDYGTFYRSQYRTWNGPEDYSYWPWGAYDQAFATAVVWDATDPPVIPYVWYFYLNHINDQRWIYCNKNPI